MTGMQLDETTGDLVLKNRTIALGENTLQCVAGILKSNRGEYKESPLIGGECVKLLHSSSSRFCVNRAKNMCQAMGIKVRRIDNNKLGEITISL